MTLKEINFIEFELQPCAVGFFPEDKDSRIWLALRDGQIRLMSSSLRLQSTVDIGLSPLNDAFYSPFSHAIIGAGRHGIRIFDLELNETFDTCLNLSNTVYKIAPLEEMKVICGGSDEVLREIDLANGTSKKLAHLGEELYSISVHPDGKHILYSSGSGNGCYTAYLGSSLSRTLVSTLSMQKVSSSFTPTGRGVLQCDEHMRLFSFPALEPVWCFSEHDGFTEEAAHTQWKASCNWSNVVFSPDGSRAFCGSPMGRIYGFNLHQAKLDAVIEAHQGNIANLAISQDGNWLLSLESQNLKLWQIDV